MTHVLVISPNRGTSHGGGRGNVSLGGVAPHFKSLKLYNTMPQMRLKILTWSEMAGLSSYIFL